MTTDILFISILAGTGIGAISYFLLLLACEAYYWPPYRLGVWRAAYQRWRKEQKHPFLKCERVGHVLEDRRIKHSHRGWDGVTHSILYEHWCCTRCRYKKIGAEIARWEEKNIFD